MTIWLVLCVQLAIASAIGVGVIAACRWLRRRSPICAHVVVAGLLVRAAVTLVLFWASYLDLPFLGHLHSGDGFWSLAVDARAYYDSAFRAAHDGLDAVVRGSQSPAFVRALGVWMWAVGSSPISGAYLNLVLFVALGVMVVAAYRPTGEWRADLPCAVMLAGLSLSPVLVVYGSQPLKDMMFVFLIGTLCVAAREFLPPLTGSEASRGSIARGFLLGAIFVAALYVVAGIRAYYAVIAWTALAVVLLLCVWRQRLARLPRYIPVCALLLASSWWVYKAGADLDYFNPFGRFVPDRKVLRMAKAAAANPASATAPAPVAPVPAPSMLTKIDGYRAGFVLTPGATNTRAKTLLPPPGVPAAAPPAVAAPQTPAVVAAQTPAGDAAPPAAIVRAGACCRGRTDACCRGPADGRCRRRATACCHRRCAAACRYRSPADARGRGRGCRGASRRGIATAAAASRTPAAAASPTPAPVAVSQTPAAVAVPPPQPIDSNVEVSGPPGTPGSLVPTGGVKGRLSALALGLGLIFVPVSLLKALSLVDFSGGRGLLMITDIDTLFMDVTLIAVVTLLVRRRSATRRLLPYLCFATILAAAAGLLMAYIVTNFGTLFRLRVMAVAPLWLLPLALDTRRRDPVDDPVARLAARTRASFGYEWTHFNRWNDSGEVSFRDYFETADLASLAGRRVLDAGCGMGRHARQMAAHARHVVAVDFSRAIEQAALNTRGVGRVDCVQADLLQLPFPDGTFDFVYSLGVLHHLGNTETALRALVSQLKPGGRLRIYLYWKRHGGVGALLHVVNAVRPVTTRLPFWLLRWLCWTLSVVLWLGVILPYRALERAGVRGMEQWPLFVYTRYPFRIIYNDQFDRFSAPLEKRYDAADVAALLESAGLRQVRVDARFGWIAEGVKPAGQA
jgi:SAM-dependent methyltransferase